MTTTDLVLDKLERATIEQHAATLATIQLCRTVLTAAKARSADDDDWLRLPSPTSRCPISHMSRSSLNRRIEEGKVRKKKIDNMTYYSGKDVRTYLNDSKPAA